MRRKYEIYILVIYLIIDLFMILKILELYLNLL
jgi:hypothetical protein